MLYGQAIIFVIDGSDELRIPVAQNELEELLEHEHIKSRSIPILFLANKSDKQNALSEQEIATRLELDQISDRPWHIQASSAT